METIVPRWEWRSFGARFGEAEKRLAGLTPGGVQESDETYLLSGAGGNVKDPCLADGHQGAARGECGRSRAVDSR